MFMRFKLNHVQVVIGSSIRYYSPRKLNAGISRQLNKFDIDDKFQEDPEGFGDLESDFMNVNKSHKDNEREEIKYREKLRHWTIKNKYFRIKYPNFLTYAEKEQIKLLHSRDSEEWTPERLSESFPANLETIEKVIKAKWAPRSIHRIRNHDEGVVRNWNLLKEGKFPELTTNLRSHILKFADRLQTDSTNFQVDESIIKPALLKPKLQEFSSIITNTKTSKVEEKKRLKGETCSKSKSKTKKDRSKSLTKDLPPLSSGQVQNETLVTQKIHDKRQMRIQDLKELKLNQTLPLSNENENKILDHPQLENPSGTGIVLIKKYDSNEVIIDRIDMKKYDVKPIKEKIQIPKKLWKKGATFKVQDTYYDDDGEFLYRVPGMTGKSDT